MHMDSSSNELDQDLFAREMAGVKRHVKQDKIVTQCQSQVEPGQQYRRQRANFTDDEKDMPLSLVLRDKLSHADWLSYKRNGIQAAVFKNLRVGKYTHEANLNLNKKPPPLAREALIEFVSDCEEMNVRSVLIFFGTGESGCLLKSFLNQWLPEIDKVQAFYTAQKHHGGQAAVYVLFKKSEQKRAENRERHAARLGNTR